jgi:hypothetical protein
MISKINNLLGFRSGSSAMRYFALLSLLTFMVFNVQTAQAAHVEPTFVSGNPTCGDFDTNGLDLIEFKIEPVASGTYSFMGVDFNITVRDTPQGEVFDFEIIGGRTYLVVAKGGPNANLYDYRPDGETADTGLHAPVAPNGRYYGLSHISFCFLPGVASIDVDKECVDPELNEDQDMIIYTITGKVTNDGDFDLFNIELVDVPPADGFFKVVDCESGDWDEVSYFPYAGPLAPGEEICYANTMTVALDQNGLMDTVTVTADWISGEVTDSATAQCPNLQIDPNIQVSKDCQALIVEEGDNLVVKVRVYGKVCNTGDTNLDNVFVKDLNIETDPDPLVSGAFLAAPFAPDHPTVDEGACIEFEGTYYPSAATDSTGTSTESTCAGDLWFMDTVEATADDIFGQPVIHSDMANCPLCYECE